MVKRQVVMLIDDVDGGDAVETVGFELDGMLYEIDLSADHVQELRECIGHWTAHARRSGHMASSSHTQPAPKLYDPKAVRAFARARGLEVPGRGRPPKHVLEQYFAAGN